MRSQESHYVVPPLFVAHILPKKCPGKGADWMQKVGSDSVRLPGLSPSLEVITDKCERSCWQLFLKAIDASQDGESDGTSGKKWGDLVYIKQCVSVVLPNQKPLLPGNKGLARV